MTRNLAFGLTFSFCLGLACGDDGGGGGTDGGGGTGPACPVGAPGCPCTGGGACDPDLECRNDICTFPDGCAIGSQGCACTGGGACDPGLLCTRDVCTPDPSGTGAATDTSGSTTPGTSGGTDPTAGPTSSTGSTAGSTAGSSGSTAGSGTSGGGSCTPGQQGCSCDGTSCDGTLMCLYGVCLTSAQPIAHWDFDGNLDDITGNGYDGFGAGTVAYGTGVDGQAVSLNGNVFVDISSFTATFVSIHNAFTVAIRHQATDIPLQNVHLFGRGGAGSTSDANSFGVWIRGGDGDIVHITSTGPEPTENVTSLGPFPPANTWAESLLVYDNGTVTYYLNGSKRAEDSYVLPDTNSMQMWIGGYPAWTWGFQGLIDDTQVYAGALN